MTTHDHSWKHVASIISLALLLLVTVIVTGCNQSVTISGNFNASSSSSYSDWNVNGQRTISRTHDGITRKLEMPATVTILDGHVTKFPQGALLKLQETGSPQPREAELHENNGTLELWIKDKTTFRKATPAEDAWLEVFLKDIVTK